LSATAGADVEVEVEVEVEERHSVYLTAATLAHDSRHERM
jgi:hypothetical protein